ncbi:88baee81-6056-493e-b937-5abcb325f600 [Thermothielavioides terrestris]|uniref:88baee81-6056-493e-b937-5abcb325f600 n=1 Tax=Thermothielavioides terrestris TaxID=2587410 RepID=A0A3S4BMZ5_9PEZI|nr:88baee81-6056-493e-b937-5abcb325f600 [Thermothielavioides terrestris]
MASDIHPWDIMINGKRWAGKVRLVGFVDSFYLICYSGVSRFEHGIVVYKDDDAIRTTLQEAKIDAAAIGLEVVNKAKAEQGEGNDFVPLIPMSSSLKYFNFESVKGGLDYRITSLGHPVSLKTKYASSSLQRYDIKLYKGRDTVMKKRIRRGVTQHGLYDQIHDAVRLGIITHAELMGMIIGKTYGGSVLGDVTSKYLDGLAGGKGSKNLALTGERA